MSGIDVVLLILFVVIDFDMNIVSLDSIGQESLKKVH